MALEEASSLLSPAPTELVAKGLTTALFLCAPAGFSENDRKAWLATALMTLKGIPADLLQRGVMHARKVADHPSKVVPAIVKEIDGEWSRRKATVSQVRRLIALAEQPAAPEPSVDPCTPEDAAAIMAEMGLTTEAKEVVRTALGPPRKPTREDYISLGVDPATIDAIMDEKKSSPDVGAGVGKPEG